MIKNLYRIFLIAILAATVVGCDELMGSSTIDEEEMGPSFRYYLSRQHWMDAHVPPLEKRLDECVAKILTI